VIEQHLQFGLGEGPLGGASFVLLRVGGGVPVKEDLGRVCAEALFADLVPAIIRVRHVRREPAERGLVTADGRVLQLVDRAEVTEILLDMLR